ncbi:MAG: hypothetical protein HGA45_09505 [Chloroflexales bacterium]|nr:hypothetical protein [Chloroflexales bacterium]
MIRHPSHAVQVQAGAPERDDKARRWRTFGELWIVGGLIAAVLLATTLPTVITYLTTPRERSFQGFVYGVSDTAQYFSWLRDHRTDWLVPNRMTSEPNNPALFNLLWLVVGRVQAATGWSAIALFHGVRVLAGAALLLVLYLFCARFTREWAERLSAFLVIVLGAGLGWVWVIVKYAQGLADVPFPFDLYVAEPNTLFILTAFPHFTIATTLILAIFLCYLAALRRRSVPLVVATAALGLLLTLQHAYDLLIITLVPAGALALMLLRDRRIPWFGALALLAIGLVALPPPLYFTWLTSGDPLWREVLDQFSNAGVFTPLPDHLLILMGVPLILVLVALLDAVLRPRRRGRLRRALAGASDADLFLLSWLGVGFLLLYIPTDFQIHMLTAWQVPVGLAAVRWLYRRAMPALAGARPRLARALPALLLVAAIPASIYLLSWRMLDLGRHKAPYSLGRDEEAALHWLGQATTRDDVVLSDLMLGQFVPVYADARTFLGHWAQTAHFYDKQQAVAAFYSTRTTDAERKALLGRYGVTYILQGAEERALGQYDPAASPLFELTFRAGTTAIYKVR